MQTEVWGFLKQFQQNTNTNQNKNTGEEEMQRVW